MSIWSISLDAIYATPIASDGVFSLFAGTVRVLDKTAGVELEPIAGGASMPSIVPAAMVRRSTLDANGVTNLATLVGSTLTVNGVTWTIVNYKAFPQPDGEAAGEVRLQLRKIFS